MSQYTSERYVNIVKPSYKKLQGIQILDFDAWEMKGNIKLYITAPSLISRLHKLLEHMLSLFQPALSSLVVSWQ
jgi:hypothetical protein